MLHDPYATATPSQRLAAAARNERLAKIGARAVQDTPIALHIVPEARPVAPAFIPTIPDENWIDRQNRINPIPKAPWFAIVGEVEGTFQPAQPRIDQIRRVVAVTYGISQTAIISERRTADIVRPRQVAMYLAKMMTTKSLPEIGRRFGGRDHTTVLHAIRKIENLIPKDRELADLVENIRSELRA